MTQGRCPQCGHMPHRHPCLNAASDNDCPCPGNTPPRCHVNEGSLLASWTEELELEESYDEGTCTRLAAWEVREGSHSRWLPVCTMHYAVWRDHGEDSTKADFRPLTLSFVIDEEQELV